MTVRKFYFYEGWAEPRAGTITDLGGAMNNDSTSCVITTSTTDDVNGIALYYPFLEDVPRGSTINQVKVVASVKFDTAGGESDIALTSMKTNEYTNQGYTLYNNDHPTAFTEISYTDPRTFVLEDLDPMTIMLHWGWYGTGAKQLDIQYLAIEVDYTEPAPLEGYTEDFISTMSLDTPIPSGAVIRGIAFSNHSTPYLAIVHSGAVGVAVYKLGSTQWEKIADPDVYPSTYGSRWRCTWAGDYLVVGIETAPVVVGYKLNTSNDTLTKIADPDAQNAVPVEEIYDLKASPDGNFIGIGLDGATGAYGAMMSINSSNDIWERITMPTFPTSIQYSVDFGGDSDVYVVTNNTWAYRHVYEYVNGAWTQATYDMWDVGNHPAMCVGLNAYSDVMASVTFEQGMYVLFKDTATSPPTWARTTTESTQPDVSTYESRLVFSKNRDYFYVNNSTGTGYTVQKYFARGGTLQYVEDVGTEVSTQISEIGIAPNGRFLAYSNSNTVTVLVSDEYTAPSTVVTVSAGDTVSSTVSKGTSVSTVGSLGTGLVAEVMPEAYVLTTDSVGDSLTVTVGIDKAGSPVHSIGEQLTGSVAKAIGRAVNNHLGIQQAVSTEYFIQSILQFLAGDRVQGTVSKSVDSVNTSSTGINLDAVVIGQRLSAVLEQLGINSTVETSLINEVFQNIVEEHGITTALSILKNVQDSISVSQGIQESAYPSKGIQGTVETLNGVQGTTGILKGIDSTVTSQNGLQEHTEFLKRLSSIIEVTHGIQESTEFNIDKAVVVAEDLGVIQLYTVTKDVTVETGDTVGVRITLATSETNTAFGIVSVSIGVQDSTVYSRNSLVQIEDTIGDVLVADITKDSQNDLSAHTGIISVTEYYKSATVLTALSEGIQELTEVFKSMQSEDLSDTTGTQGYPHVSTGRFSNVAETTGYNVYLVYDHFIQGVVAIHVGVNTDGAGAKGSTIVLTTTVGDVEQVVFRKDVSSIADFTTGVDIDIQSTQAQLFSIRKIALTGIKQSGYSLTGIRTQSHVLTVVASNIELEG